MKRLISILLSLSILLSVSSIGFNALASEGGFSIGVSSLNAPLPSFNSAIGTSAKKTYKGETYYGDGKELYAIVRDCMDNRGASVDFRYYSEDGISSVRTLANVIVDIIKHSWSDEMSVTSTDGDYSHWGICDLDFDYTRHSANYYDFTLKFGYYNTDKQERAVDSEINKIVNSIRKKNWSDYTIIKYIHDYICNSTTYCYEAVDKPSAYPTAFTAYGALIGGECVCQGYAVAFYRICRELGYNVRFVYSGQGNHAWNIIQIDDKSYFVDCTWDDNIMDKADSGIYDSINNDPYYYFLADYSTMRSQDGIIFFAQAHLVDKEMSLDENFDKKYMSILSDKKYDAEKCSNLISSCSISTEYSTTVYNASARMPVVSVSDINGNALVKDKDYRVSYSSNTNCGRGLIRITGIGDYSGMKATRSFLITPSKMSTPSIASGGRKATSLNVKWSELGGKPSGYILEREQNYAWATVADITSPSKVSYAVKSLSANSNYRFRVRAYKTIGRIRYYGSTSNVLSTYTVPKTPAMKPLKSKKSVVTVSWGKVSCSGYEIQYSTNKSMKGAKTTTASSSSTSKKMKSLKKGKKYYIRVRAYKKVTNNGKVKYYRSPWCTKKSITVK